MSHPYIREDLRREATSLELAVLDAFASGTAEQEGSPIPARLAAFEDAVETAHQQGQLDNDTEVFLHTIASRIVVILSRFTRQQAKATDIQSTLRSDVQHMLDSTHDPDPHNSPKATSFPFAWVRPLLQFVADNISSPYPSAAEKQTLLEQCEAAGWTSVTQRKLEDWMNMARGRMGYTLILKSDAVAEDRQLMADYVRRVLTGNHEDRAGVPAVIVRQIEMMQRWVFNQYESRAARDQTSSWAYDVVGLVQRLVVHDDIGPDALPDNRRGDNDSDGGDSDWSDWSDWSDSSDSDTLYSDTDVEEDAEDALVSIIGTKRKYSGLGLGHPPAQTVLRTSSSSSLASHMPLADAVDRVASGIGCSAPQPHDEHDRERPAKRRRGSLDGSSDEATSPAPTAIAESPPAKAQPVEQPYRSQKRKRASSDDESRSSPLKRVRQLDPMPSTHVPLISLDGLTSICQLDWNAPIASAEVDIDLDWGDVGDASLLDGVPSTDDPFDTAVTSCESSSNTSVDTGFAWCKLQVYTLERMLRHGVHVVPSPDASPAGSTPTIMVDASLFNSEELAYLNSLSMEDPDVGQACVETPDLLEPGPNCPDAIGLSQWSVDLSDPTPSDGAALPSVDIDEWIASLLNEPFST